MREYQKIIREDIEWLFFHYELDECKITKSVDSDRDWDYVLKLKMGEPKEVFQGVRVNEDGTVDCVPPWSFTELMDVIQSLEESMNE